MELGHRDGRGGVVGREDRLAREGGHFNKRVQRDKGRKMRMLSSIKEEDGGFSEPGESIN